MESISRREFLSSTKRLSIAAAFGAPMLTIATPARAWVTAALGIAQAGFSLYQMSRGGGGGIGKLLAAQMEMLIAINRQLQVISDTLMKVYEEIGEIRSTLNVMPQMVTQEVFRGQVRGAIGWGGAILETVEEVARTNGRYEATVRYESEARQALAAIRQPISFLANEASTANIPLVCLSWYAELQLMTNAVAYDPFRIRTAAQAYLAPINRWLPMVQTEIGNINVAATALAKKVSAMEGVDGQQCITDLSYRLKDRSCGHDGNFTCYEGSTHHFNNTLTRKPEPNSDDLAQFLVAAADLEASGASISDALGGLLVPQWDLIRLSDPWSYSQREDTRPYDSRLVALRQQICSGVAANPLTWSAAQNSLRQEANDLRLRAVVNYHFFLAATEAKRSIEAVLERLPSAA